MDSLLSKYLNRSVLGFYVLIISLGLFLGFARAFHPRDTNAQPPVAADPDARLLAESIIASMDDFKAGTQDLAEASKSKNRAQIKILHALLSAKTADSLLCSKFQAVFDRQKQVLIHVKDCPTQ